MNRPPLDNPSVDNALPPSSQRRSVIILALIVLAALGIRLIYLQQIQTIPFFSELISDAERYDQWARTIADGAWLGDDTFYQAPLYPYFLAVIKTILGDNPLMSRVVQVVLGSLSCGLIALAGGAFFGRRAGLTAGVLWALYGPAIFFDGLIQKTSLGQFLFCLTLALMGWQHLRPDRPARASLAGVALGLFCLTRENALALLPILLGWAWLLPASNARFRRLRRTVSLLFGTLLVLMPIAVRNYAVGGEFVLTTAQAGPNFYIGNNPEATGRYRPLVKGHETPEFEQADAQRLAEQALEQKLTPAQVSRYWLGQSWWYIRAQPLHWLRLLAVKTALVWNAYEIPDSESYYIYRQWSWLLGVLGSLLHFGVLVPLAAGGAVLTWSRRRELWVHYALLAVITAAVATFFVFARYRHPIAPVAVLFAGAGLAETLAYLRTGRRRLVWTALAVTAATAVVVNLRINPEGQLDAMAWGNLGGTLARRQNLGGAIVCFERGLEGAPSSAELHYNLGLAYAVQGRHAQAIPHLQSAARLAPEMVEVDFQLAQAFERIGRVEDARRHYQRAVDVNPQDAQARAGLRRLGG